MVCPHCQRDVSQVIDSRPCPLGVRRRRRCCVCGHRWTTHEVAVADKRHLGELHGAVAELEVVADDLAEATRTVAQARVKLKNLAAGLLSQAAPQQEEPLGS